MDDYRATLPEPVLPHLKPLDSFLRARQSIEQQQLAKTLESPRYRQLVRSWRNFLDRAPTPASDVVNAERPILEIASERIWKAYRRVAKKGAAITAASPADALHQLRLDCKKLRYLLEFFRSLYDAKTMGKADQLAEGTPGQPGRLQRPPSAAG